MGKILFICLISVIEISGQPDSIMIYLVKQKWHTGIVIKTDNVDSLFFPEIRYFSHLKYIDVGWGDAEFYRYPGFDVGLAYKALFHSTPSTIRVEGFNFSIEKYMEISDQGFQILINKNTFNRLCRFLSLTFHKPEGKVEVIEKRYGGNITFFKAKGLYNLFNTCNTWVARCFNEAGIKIEGKIILAEQLFGELEDIKQAKRLK